MNTASASVREAIAKAETTRDMLNVPMGLIVAAAMLSGPTTRDYYTTPPRAVMGPKPLRWARPQAAFLRYTDEKRWENYRDLALMELDEELP